MKKQLAVLKSMVSKNVNMGRQKGGPQGRNNKVITVNLDPSLGANPPIATVQGPIWDSKLPSNVIDVWGGVIPGKTVQHH